MRKWWAVPAVVALGLVAACGNGDTGGDNGGDDYGLVPIYTPRAGGTANIVGSAIANVLSQHIDGVQASVEATTGSQEMVQRLEERRQANQPAFAVMDTAGPLWAYEGQDPYDQEYISLRTMTFTGASDLYVVVPADSDIESYGDLTGRRVALGGPGSTPQLLAEELIEYHGVPVESYTPEYLSYDDIVDGLANGSLDAGVLAGAPPVSAYSELATTQDVRIVPVDEDVRERLIEERPYFYESTVEGGEYRGMDTDVPAVGFGTSLVTFEEVPDELVERVMEAIYEHHDQLVSSHGSMAVMLPENAAQSVAIPFHPAAESVITERGGTIEN